MGLCVCALFCNVKVCLEWTFVSFCFYFILLVKESFIYLFVFVLFFFSWPHVRMPAVSVRHTSYRMTSGSNPHTHNSSGGRTDKTIVWWANVLGVLRSRVLLPLPSAKNNLRSPAASVFLSPEPRVYINYNHQSFTFWLPPPTTSSPKDKDRYPGSLSFFVAVYVIRQILI